jgi:hypothetical protein
MPIALQFCTMVVNFVFSDWGYFNVVNVVTACSREMSLESYHMLN